MQVLCHTYSYYLRFVARPFSFSSSCPTNQSISPIRCVWMRGQAEPLRLLPEGVWGSTDLGMLKFFVLLDLPPGMGHPKRRVSYFSVLYPKCILWVSSHSELSPP